MDKIRKKITKQRVYLKPKQKFWIREKDKVGPVKFIEAGTNLIVEVNGVTYDASCGMMFRTKEKFDDIEGVELE